MGIASPCLNRAGLVRRLPPNGLRLANVYRGTDFNLAYRNGVYRQPCLSEQRSGSHISVAERRKARGHAVSP